MEEIIINHPCGDCTLQSIANDSKAWAAMKGYSSFGFTSMTIDALIKKIIDLSEEIKRQENVIDYLNKSCD